MKNKFKSMLCVVLILLMTQFIGCAELSTTTFKVSDENKDTMTNTLYEKKSFTEKILEILFGEKKSVKTGPYVKNYTFPKRLKIEMENGLFNQYDITTEDRYYHTRDLFDKYINEEIPFDSMYTDFLLSADISSNLDNSSILREDNYVDWLGCPMKAEGYFRQTINYDFDEIVVCIEGFDSFNYFCIVPYDEDLDKWTNGDWVVVYGDFKELLFDEDKSAGYTKYIPTGAELMGPYAFNFDKDINKDYKMTPAEKEFYYNTEYVMITEAMYYNKETDELEKSFDTGTFEFTETEITGLPYTVKSMAKIGPNIEIMLRLNDTYYDNEICDKMILYPDGTFEYMYSYLDVNQDNVKETPSDYYIFGWRESKIY